MKKEESIHIAVCNYLRLQYSHVIFTSESGGIRLTMGQAVKAKKLRSSSGLPDLWILQPMNGWHGLFLELKAKSIYLKSGELKKDQHILEQSTVITRLKMLGYWACFACGFDQAKKIIDWYMTPNGIFKNTIP